MEQGRSGLIKQHPIGDGLDAFRTSFGRICERLKITCTPNAVTRLGKEDLRGITLSFLVALQSCKVSALLSSKTEHGTLQNKILKILSAATAEDFSYGRVIHLLELGLNKDNDILIWNYIDDFVIGLTPPPPPIASSLRQTPSRHNTSGLANSSENRQQVDRALKEELDPLYVGLPRFYEIFFGRVKGLDAASAAIFEKCMDGSEPLFRNGWLGWPRTANQDDVLAWFADLCEKLMEFTKEYSPRPPNQRRPLAQPNKPIYGSTGERKLDVGFVDDPEAGKDSRYHWAQIIIPGELKSNPAADTASKAWLDLGTYAREVLRAQDSRRFVLGFTICGSLMRIWEFDRLGGIASEQFDINEEGKQFVLTVLGFMWMNNEELGFDPTIQTSENGRRFIEIRHNDNSAERLILDELIYRAPCIVGRATTCWRAHREGYPQQTLVIKDSWQFPEREDEGELLRAATREGVINVARYYYHETVQIRGVIDDIKGNIRGGLDVTRATNYRSERSTHLPIMVSGAPRRGRSSGAGQKRSSSQTGAPIPRSKRSCSSSPTKPALGDAIPNREHRRTVTSDCGQPIYTASSRPVLLATLRGHILGHQSLFFKAGLLHRDISIHNLLINEDQDNPSWPAFVNDLDLTIPKQRATASGAKAKTGTKAFMAIGALLGEQHSFMHDLESFFWVLFWICIHYDGPKKSRSVKEFDDWNFASTEELAKLKLGTIADEALFKKTVADNFTPYYEPLLQLVNDLRKVVFPQGGRWKWENENLYQEMLDILQHSDVA